MHRDLAVFFADRNQRQHRRNLRDARKNSNGPSGQSRRLNTAPVCTRGMAFPSRAAADTAASCPATCACTTRRHALRSPILSTMRCPRIAVHFLRSRQPRRCPRGSSGILPRALSLHRLYNRFRNPWVDMARNARRRKTPCVWVFRCGPSHLLRRKSAR